MMGGVVLALSTVRVAGADLMNVVVGEGKEWDIHLYIQRFESQRVDLLESHNLRNHQCAAHGQQSVAHIFTQTPIY